MNKIKMAALQSFLGAEGRIKRGQFFHVDGEHRARDLEKKKLAKKAEGDGEPGPQNQQTAGPNETQDLKPNETKNEAMPKEEAAVQFPKPTKGGWFELSNGDKIQGKEAAEKAEKELAGETNEPE